MKRTMMKEQMMLYKVKHQLTQAGKEPLLPRIRKHRWNESGSRIFSKSIPEQNCKKFWKGREVKWLIANISKMTRTFKRVGWWSGKVRLTHIEERD